MARVRPGGYVVAACAAALAFGVLLPVAPKAAVAALTLIPLAFAAPEAALVVIVAVTVLVPFDVQDAFAVIGGRDRPGLLVVDVLMLLGLLRVGWLLARRRLRVDRPLLAGMTVGVVFSVALVWGLLLGAAVSGAGHEARRMVLGVGTFLLALPLLQDSAARRRLLAALTAIGLGLGVWGLAQWVFSVGYTTSGDVGVRPGVDLTSSGHGQLQGGMYAFGVAVIVAWSVLLSGHLQRAWSRWLVAVILLLNAGCLILTFERTLWVATAVGCAAVAMTSGARTRRAALKWTGVGFAALVAVAAISPGVARTAVERFASISQVATDTSFTSRLVESRAVLDAIAARPLTGSGFGATITWGQRDVFATVTTSFSHNGYLWLAWKIGVPAALFVVGVIVAGVLRRIPAAGAADWAALQRGSKAALFSLLLVCVTFPVFNVLGITAAVGLLLAVACSSSEGVSA
ncbi:MULTISPECIES: O-antigen ligase family protein [unclassified Mycobacterium]|uniref:O-antigen ligase family protein n=1 Tax=unclassified Mycobacterium TaxID=2642494 RepID=UPI0029C6D31E|nr:MULTISPECIES: O-antigen ligase family protein [unclassified Mycobacterium]